MDQFSHDQQQQQQQQQHAQQKKRDYRPFDSDIQPIDLPRKKFVSEECFANKLAAMSLETEYYPNIPKDPTQPRRYNLRSNSIVEDDGTANHTMASLNDQVEQEEEEQQEQHMMPVDTADGKPLFEVDRNGLPMELKPGDNKFRVPDFVLNNSELTDPRDLQALHNIMNPKKHTHIEVLNNPSVHYAPTSMDID